MDFEKSRSTSTDLDGAQSSAKAREEVRWSSTDLDESKGIAKYAIESEEPHQTSADRDGSRKISRRITMDHEVSLLGPVKLETSQHLISRNSMDRELMDREDTR